jgi:hypothetical protein
MVDSMVSGHVKNSVLSWRSVFFGLTGLFMMSGLAGYHDQALGGTLMIGNHLPGGAFTYFIFLGLVWNGFWVWVDRVFNKDGAVRRSMVLTSREMVFVIVVTLVACFPPTSGFFRYFHRMIMMPWYFLSNHADWQTYGVLTKHLRPEFFPEPWLGDGIKSQMEYERVYKSFFTGLARGTTTVPLWKLPLDAWVRPMMIWGPTIFLLALTVISLQFVLHRQWAVHEQLSYPVAQVARSFCDMNGSRGQGVPDIFRNRLFWWGCLPVLFLLAIDYLALWFPNSVPSIVEFMPDLKHWYLPVTTRIPILTKVTETWCLNWQTLYFTIVGMAFFTSTEVSFTMGIGPILLAIFGIGYYFSTGTSLQYNHVEVSRAGAYVGYTIMLCYAGRHYYSRILALALGFKKLRKNEKAALEQTEQVAIMAARVLLLSFIGFVIVLSWMCQSWVIAVFYSLVLIILYTVISRIVCESGLPFVLANWYPTVILHKLMGPAAMGPKAMTFSLWSTGIFAMDPRESLMPYVATSIKLADDTKIRLKRIFLIITGAVAVALIVAFFSSTYSLYNYKVMSDTFAATSPTQWFLDTAARSMSEMELLGVLEESANASALGRLKYISGITIETRFFFFGAIGVLILSILRFRFPKFPIHPILFLMVGTYPAALTWAAFLLGWFIKIIVIKFGGGSVYNRLKPLFAGIIAGELLMVGITLIVDFIYFFASGSASPIKYFVMPP